MSKRANTNFRINVIDLVLVAIMLVMFLVGGMFFGKIPDREKLFNIAKTDVDFIIQTPSREQLENIGGMSHVNSVVPFIYTIQEISAGNKDVNVNLFIVEKAADIAKTNFSDELLVEKSDVKYDNPVAISEELSTKYGLKLGSDMTFKLYGKDFHYKVSSIYLSDHRLSGGMALIINDDVIRSLMIEHSGENYIYSGAFIDSKDVASTSAWTQSYVPEGDLKTREDFTTDELYEAYIKHRESIDYTLSTFNRANFLSNMHRENDGYIIKNRNLSIVLPIIGFVLMLAYLFARMISYINNSVRLDIEDKFGKVDEQKMFNKYYAIIMAAVLVIALILCAVNMAVFNIAYFSIVNILGIVFSIASVGIVWIIEMIVLNKKFFKKEADEKQ